jgi:hypothetical protein
MERRIYESILKAIHSISVLHQLGVCVNNIHVMHSLALPFLSHTHLKSVSHDLHVCARLNAKYK